MRVNLVDFANKNRKERVRVRERKHKEKRSEKKEYKMWIVDFSKQKIILKNKKLKLKKKT